MWSEAGGTWAGTVVGAIAVYFALKTWRASVTAIRSGYRPLVTPVAPEEGALGDQLILKNYGSGPAIAVVVLHLPEDKLLGTVGILEPLDSGDANDWDRIGRIRIRLREPMLHGGSYRLLYQDLGGRWHETSFDYWRLEPRPDDIPVRLGPSLDRVRYLGIRRAGLFRRQVPWGVANFLGQVASKAE